MLDSRIPTSPRLRWTGKSENDKLSTVQQYLLIASSVEILTFTEKERPRNEDREKPRDKEMKEREDKDKKQEENKDNKYDEEMSYYA